ncbi:hypothetical protein [Methylobacterium sp. ID0610]|uniref:hypothetical protein n=1 Tax=Methylobacterium carpenticola TaxID=3344827 RepID=UPI0036A507FB
MTMTYLAAGFGALMIAAAAGISGASAAPAMPAPGLVEGYGTGEPAAYRRHHRRYRHDHRQRDLHRRNRAWRNNMIHGDPNARNPSRPGYQQQRGNTSGGPRF